MKKTFIHKSSYVDDGVKIGAGTSSKISHIMSGTIIGSNCSIGQNVVIGPNVEIEITARFKIMFQFTRDLRSRMMFS